MRLRQNVTGERTEQLVLQRLTDLGLAASKPKRDVGVDLEVWLPSAPDRKLNLQVKGRGATQTNERYRWFQIRTTERQRRATVEAGLPVSEAWRKKVALCEFFVLVALKFDECWVLSAAQVIEAVRMNARVHGRRADNLAGKQAELDLDIERDGRPLTEIFAACRNDFGPIVAGLSPRTGPARAGRPGVPQV